MLKIYKCIVIIYIIYTLKRNYYSFIIRDEIKENKIKFCVLVLGRGRDLFHSCQLFTNVGMQIYNIVGKFWVKLLKVSLLSNN